MSYVSNYLFDNLSRLGQDECVLQQKDIQNATFSNYMLENYNLSDCNMTKPINLATSQPAINYKGFYGGALTGCNIEDNSKLLIGQINTHPKCRISLFSRPFATVPYMGRGNVNAITESKIQQGEQTINKKTATNLSQMSVDMYYPNIVQDIKKDKLDEYYTSMHLNSQNNLNGISTRDLYRDTCNKTQYKK
jgi:hypothetical protein